MKVTIIISYKFSNKSSVDFHACFNTAAMPKKRVESQKAKVDMRRGKFGRIR